MSGTIPTPRELKDMDNGSIALLCQDLRERILQVCAKNGGHLASNLGIVETTVALHRVFDLKKDRLIFDVGHQCYAHKLLTGREEAFSTLRQLGGISGFPNRFESEYDPLCEGHCGTSISSALGFAEADRRLKRDNWTIALAGGGAFTNGMIYEALNNCSEKKLRLIILLNDNGMSISGSVGALPRHLSAIRSSKGYLNIKNNTRTFLEHIPLIGRTLASGVRRFKNFWKKILLQPVIFDDFGVTYLGPVDGNDEEAVETILREARRREEICIVHLLTQKGKGYPQAEKDPTGYHSTGSFDADLGLPEGGKKSFSSVFGDEVCAMAEKDPTLAVITAAMTDGTGLGRCSREHGDRFFDVGIAEEHAVTFAAGLAAGGMRPVAAIYSTFLQRSYDQLIHDISLQGLDLVLAVDRAGFVAGDGLTHQGILDVPMLTTIPRSSIWSPETYAELEEALEAALRTPGVAAVRYPRGREADYDRSLWQEKGDLMVYEPDTPTDLVLISYGRVSKNLLEAAVELGARAVKLKKLWPLDLASLVPLLEGAKRVLFAEEGFRHGGLGEQLGAALMEAGAGSGLSYRVLAVEDYLPHASVEELDRLTGLDREGILRTVREMA